MNVLQQKLDDAEAEVARWKVLALVAVAVVFAETVAFVVVTKGGAL